jgi:rhamnulokinase
MMQEIRRTWAEQGFDCDWIEMAGMANKANPFEFFINPADEVFVAPGDMPLRIQDYCERTGQKRPQERGQILRAAYEGLALLYADTYDTLETLSGKKMEFLRIVGGGCQNRILSQFAADATGRDVITGPVEATAIGNLIMQMLAMGDIASLDEGRAIIRKSFEQESKTYHPQDAGDWQQALAKWRKIVNTKL